LEDTLSHVGVSESAISHIAVSESISPHVGVRSAVLKDTRAVSVGGQRKTSRSHFGVTTGTTVTPRQSYRASSGTPTAHTTGRRDSSEVSRRPTLKEELVEDTSLEEITAIVPTTKRVSSTYGAVLEGTLPQDDVPAQFRRTFYPLFWAAQCHTTLVTQNWRAFYTAVVPALQMARI
jgi:hypothetical protein